MIPVRGQWGGAFDAHLDRLWADWEAANPDKANALRAAFEAFSAVSAHPEGERALVKPVADTHATDYCSHLVAHCPDQGVTMTEAAKTDPFDELEDTQPVPEPVDKPEKTPAKKTARKTATRRTAASRKEAELPASYPTKSGNLLVNVTRPWGPIVVTVVPKGWHGPAALDLPLEELGELIDALKAAQSAHEGQK
jgi:Pyruvate/2-oxoacid:ferredoxin oxidoreductase delta subunit